MIKKITIKGLLSWEEGELELAPLNVLVGPNASGKLNFLDVISLLQAVPSDLTKATRRTGGLWEWFWKGAPGGNGEDLEGIVEAVVSDPLPSGKADLCYILRLGLDDLIPEIREERLERVRAAGRANPHIYFTRQRDHGSISQASQGDFSSRTRLKMTGLARGVSVFDVRRDAQRYPEVTALGRLLGQIRVYSDWQFGREAPMRSYQAADLSAGDLFEDGSNLAMYLNGIQREGYLDEIEDAMREVYEDFGRVGFDVGGGMMRVQVSERHFRRPIPATRMSDGTLRYLFLVALLKHRTPPPLICIEEPELGLHPDMIPLAARMLRDAATWTQVIVTTHSEALVSQFTSTPDVVVTFDRSEDDGQTIMKRVPSDVAEHFKEDLGRLWVSGELGGVRY